MPGCSPGTPMYPFCWSWAAALIHAERLGTWVLGWGPWSLEQLH